MASFALLLCSAMTSACCSKNRAATYASEKIERAGVFVLRLIGRIKVDDIDRLRQFAKPLQHGSDAAVFERETPAYLQRSEILPQRRQRRLSVFRKPDMRSTAAYRLDSNRSSAGVEIDEAATFEPRRKDIEECLAQAVAGGTGLHAARSSS